MFDSLQAGYAPICLLVLAASWFIARVGSPRLRVALALVTPVAISAAWFFMPRLPAPFRPLAFNEDPWVPWGFMATAAWAVFAVPVSVLGTFGFWLTRRRSPKHGTP